MAGRKEKTGDRPDEMVFREIIIDREIELGDVVGFHMAHIDHFRPSLDKPVDPGDW